MINVILIDTIEKNVKSGLEITLDFLTKYRVFH